MGKVDPTVGSPQDTIEVAASHADVYHPPRSSAAPASHEVLAFSHYIDRINRLLSGHRWQGGLTNEPS